MWAALTALFIVFLAVTLASVIWVTANLISYLQPILIPVAIAAILAYLLDPVVTRMCRGGLGRTLRHCVALFCSGLRPALSLLVACSHHLDTEREFREGASRLYAEGPR